MYVRMFMYVSMYMKGANILLTGDGAVKLGEWMGVSSKLWL